MSEPKNPEQRNLEKEYEEYVKMITPTHNLYLQMLKAFIVGGDYLCNRAVSSELCGKPAGNG